jgi:hypothetical protein
MERQGEMVDCAAGLVEPWAVDPDLGGVLLEVHQCATCGRVATRRRLWLDFSLISGTFPRRGARLR